MAMPTRYDPFRQFSLLGPIVDLGDLLRGSRARSLSRAYEKTLEMSMDVHEDDTAYRININVPGVKKEDIEVTVEGTQVTISAEVKREQSHDNEKEVFSERFYGKALRSFSLPGDVESSKSEARYDGGVSSLTLPATHLFEEPGALERVAATAGDWLVRMLAGGSGASRGAAQPA